MVGRVLEGVLIFAAICFVLSQVIAPAILGRPIFGMFRKEAKIKKEISQAFQEHDEAALLNERDRIRDETKTIRSSTDGN